MQGNEHKKDKNDNRFLGHDRFLLVTALINIKLLTFGGYTRWLGLTLTLKSLNSSLESPIQDTKITFLFPFMQCPGSLP